MRGSGPCRGHHCGPSWSTSYAGGTCWPSAHPTTSVATGPDRSATCSKSWSPPWTPRPRRWAPGGTGGSCGRGSTRPSGCCPQSLLAYRNRSHLRAGSPGSQHPADDRLPQGDLRSPRSALTSRLRARTRNRRQKRAARAVLISGGRLAFRRGRLRCRIGWCSSSQAAGLVGGRHEFAEELLDAAVDLIADAADHLDGLAGGVLELPVLIALARVDRTGVPAAHGDDHIIGLDRGVGERLGGRPREGD